jgi:hypothetical protein
LPKRQLLLALLALGVAGRAQALDPFEIQVYDAEVLDKGDFMQELHVIWRPEAAEPAIGPSSGLPDPGLLHFAFEPQVGIAPQMEVGAYFETALWPDGSFRIEGAKLRYKVRVKEGAWPFEAALNFEVGIANQLSGDPLWGGELRPILTKKVGPLRMLFNPIIGWALSPLAVPTFEPAAKVNCEVAWNIAPGLEYYGDIGSINAPRPLALEQHFLFYTVDVYHWSNVELGLGLGEPLTRASGGWIGNANLGYQF